VALGVGALLLSLAIVRGFSDEIQDKITGIGAHIQVQSYVDGAPLRRSDVTADQLSRIDGVADTAPVVEDVVLLRKSTREIDGVVLSGRRELPEYLRSRLVKGRFSAPSGHSPLVIGAAMAERLGLAVGDTVTSFSLRSEGDGDAQAGIQSPRVEQFQITGIFETSLQEIDDLYAFTSLSEARKLTGTPSETMTRFDLRLNDISRVDSTAASIENQFGFPVAAQTIYEQRAGLFAWVDLQQSIIPLVIGVIVVVAAFNIIGTLLMLILEKTREIGVLQSLGTSQRTLKRLFLLLGVLIGTVGTAIGASSALGLALLQKRFDLIPLPAEAYYMTTAPVALHPLDYLIVAVLTVALCALSAYVPARTAARIEPVRAIRFQ
jgi:lipoprotein-releasing system permease protein